MNRIQSWPGKAQVAQALIGRWSVGTGFPLAALRFCGGQKSIAAARAGCFTRFVGAGSCDGNQNPMPLRYALQVRCRTVPWSDAATRGLSRLQRGCHRRSQRIPGGKSPSRASTVTRFPTATRACAGTHRASQWDCFTVRPFVRRRAARARVVGAHDVLR